MILAKADGNPVTPPTNRRSSNFPSPPSGGRPNRPVYVPKYRTAPQVVNVKLISLLCFKSNLIVDISF